MGLPVDNTLDFNERAATPGAPSAGITQLYSKTTGGLFVQSSVLPETQLLTVAAQNPTTWYYSGTSTPTGIVGMLAGDYCVRELDGEVFEYVSGAWVDQGFSTQGTTSQVYSSLTRVYRQAALTTTAGENAIPFDTASFDNGPNYTLGANGSYSCPVSGFYRVSGQVSLTITPGYFYLLQIYKNGVEVARGIEIGERDATSGDDLDITVDDIVQCVAGDHLQIVVYTQAPSALQTGYSYLNYGSFQLVGSITDAPISPNTAARAYRSANFTLTAGAWTKFPFDTISNDPGGHFSTANSRYTVASAGTYSVKSQIMQNVSGTSVDTWDVSIYKNGVQYSYTSTGPYEPAAGDNVTVAITDEVTCVAGDYLEIYYYSAVANSEASDSAQAWFSVVKVDQPAAAPANTGWFTPVLTNGWVPLTNAPQYMKDANGFVHIRGAAANGTSGDLAFTLPTGFRPGITDYYKCLGSSDSGTAYVEVSTAGAVTITASGDQLYFGSINFLAEN